MVVLGRRHRIRERERERERETKLESVGLGRWAKKFGVWTPLMGPVSKEVWIWVSKEV